ncbi:MAG TPA: hypothetical protein VLZ83_12485 [Edaphocola sp.]|nr:hypothetical protein [Edaphocola sp.]
MKTFNVIFGGICILGVVVWFIYYQIKGNEMGKEFYKDTISSYVIKFNSFYGRSVEFHLEDGKRLYFMPPINDKIIIGDSIRKDANTYVYDVYRKQPSGEYKFWTTYNLMHTN